MWCNNRMTTTNRRDVLWQILHDFPEHSIVRLLEDTTFSKFNVPFACGMCIRLNARGGQPVRAIPHFTLYRRVCYGVHTEQKSKTIPPWCGFEPPTSWLQSAMPTSAHYTIEHPPLHNGTYRYEPTKQQKQNQQQHITTATTANHRNKATANKNLQQ